MDLPRALDPKFASGEDGEEVGWSALFGGNDVAESDDDKAVAPVSVEVRMRLALASSKEISEKAAADGRSVQPGRRSALGRKFCGEQMAATGEDMFLVLIGDVRTFDPTWFTEESGIEILARSLNFDIDRMGNGSVAATSAKCVAV